MHGSVSIFRRVFGWLADYLAVMIPGMAIVLLAMAQLVHGLPGFVGGVAAEMGWGYLVGLIFHTGAGGGAPVSGEWLTFALPLIVALLLVPLLQFVYQGVMLSWRGRTLGKMLMDTRISASRSDTGRPSRGAAVRRAFLTTTLETGVVAAALVLITIGQLFFGFLLWGAAIVAFWVNALSILAPRHRTIVDRLSGTAVVPRGLYAELATAARSALPTRRTPTEQPALTPGAPPHLALPSATTESPAFAQAARDAGAGQPVNATGFAPPVTAAGSSQPVSAAGSAQSVTAAGSAMGRLPVRPAAYPGTQPPPPLPAAYPATQPPPPVAAAYPGAQPPLAQPGFPAPAPVAPNVAPNPSPRIKASEAALAAGRATADAAAVAGQLAKEGAETVMRSAPVQQALNSRAGQQAQALGTAGAERAREIGAAGAEQARKLRGRAQEMWRQRRAKGDGDPDPDGDRQQP